MKVKFNKRFMSLIVYLSSNSNNKIVLEFCIKFVVNILEYILYKKFLIFFLDYFMLNIEFFLLTL